MSTTFLRHSEETFFAVDPLHLEICEVEEMYLVDKDNLPCGPDHAVQHLVRDVDTGEHLFVSRIHSDYEQAVDELEDLMIEFSFNPDHNKEASLTALLTVFSYVFAALTLAALILAIF